MFDTPQEARLASLLKEEGAFAMSPEQELRMLRAENRLLKQDFEDAGSGGGDIVGVLIVAAFMLGIGVLVGHFVW